MAKDCKNIFEKISVESIKSMTKTELIKVGVVGVASLAVVGGAISAVTGPTEILDVPEIEDVVIEDVFVEEEYENNWEVNVDIDPNTYTTPAPGVTELGDPNGVPSGHIASIQIDTPKWIDGDDIYASYVRSASRGEMNLDVFHPSVQGNVTMNSDYGFYEGKSFTVTEGYILDMVGYDAGNRASNYSWLEGYAPHLSLDKATMSAYDDYNMFYVLVAFTYEENGQTYTGNLKGTVIDNGVDFYFLDAYIEYGL